VRGSPARRVALVGAVLLAVVSPASSGGSTPQKPNVLLITVDTLRPDALGWVAGANATPALDALARDGFRFPAAVAEVPLTLPSHTSLMTGLIPRRHGVRDNGQLLGPGPKTLAEALAAAGYRTAAFVSGFPLAAQFGLDRGFGHYDDALPNGEEGREERHAEATTAAAAAWIAKAREPWFVWVHYYDPHHPYEPPARFRRPGRRGAYDGEVAYADQEVGALRAAVAQAAKRSVVTVFAGDHGESLGEHGEATHGYFIYDSTVLVPLVFSYPGKVAPGTSPAPARLIDVAPTLLALLGLPPLAGVDGVSLAPTLAGHDQEVPPAYVETREPWTSYGWSPLRALRDGRWKLIAAPKPELYDLASDPGETTNLIDRQRPEARRLETALKAVEATPAAASRAAADPDAAAKLRALGYLGGGNGDAASEPPPGLPDPKDRLALRDLLTAGEEAMIAGDPRTAVGKFDAVLASDPGNRFAWFRSGSALLSLGDVGGAVDRFQQAVALDPRQPEARYGLAQTLTRAGRYPQAVDQWLELASLQPRRAGAWSGLATALGLAGRRDDAVDAFHRAFELAPDDLDLEVRLAFAEFGAGRRADAARHLAAAAAAWHDGPFPHAGALGILLSDEGKTAEARKWLGRSRPGEGDFAEARLRLALLAAGAGDSAAARQALADALAADPRLRPRAAADPRLAPYLP
jgi:choline-sulfatase